MTAPEDFTLDSVERASTVWAKIEKHLSRRLEKARDRNDSPLPPDETALVRGEIKALKALLRLGQEKPPQVDG